MKKALLYGTMGALMTANTYSLEFNDFVRAIFGTSDDTSQEQKVAPKKNPEKAPTQPATSITEQVNANSNNLQARIKQLEEQLTQLRNEQGNTQYLKLQNASLLQENAEIKASYKEVRSQLVDNKSFLEQKAIIDAKALAGLEYKTLEKRAQYRLNDQDANQLSSFRKWAKGDLVEEFYLTPNRKKGQTDLWTNNSYSLKVKDTKGNKKFITVSHTETVGTIEFDETPTSRKLTESNFYSLGSFQEAVSQTTDYHLMGETNDGINFDWEVVGVKPYNPKQFTTVKEKDLINSQGHLLTANLIGQSPFVTSKIAGADEAIKNALATHDTFLSQLVSKEEIGRHYHNVALIKNMGCSDTVKVAYNGSIDAHVLANGMENPALIKAGSVCQWANQLDHLPKPYLGVKKGQITHGWASSIHELKDIFKQYDSVLIGDDKEVSKNLIYGIKKQ